MRSRALFVGAAVVVAAIVGRPASASTIAYTDQSLFLAAVQNPGTDTYDDLSLGLISSPLGRTAGAYGYSASASGGLDGAGSIADVWLAAFTNERDVLFSGFSPSVTAIGGDFFGTDNFGNFLAGQTITVTLVDGNGPTMMTLPNITNITTFLGFVSDSPLISLSISAVNPPATLVFPTVNNLTLAEAGSAAPVPEPASLTLLGLGLAGMAGRRWRQRKA